MTDAHVLAAALGLVSALALALRAAPPAFASFARLANSLSTAVDANTKRLRELEDLSVQNTETIRVLRETLDGRSDELSDARDQIALKDRALSAARTEMAELRRSIDPKTSFTGAPK